MKKNLHKKPSQSFIYFSLCLCASVVLLFNVSVFSQTTLDNQTYNYTPNTNQLNYITDVINSNASTIDIDNQTNFNYNYNAIGQLKTDVAEGILSIEWNALGKVKFVKIDDRPRDGIADRTLTFKYDAMGNRIKKIETIIATAKTTTTFYALAASGKQTAIYESDGTTIKRIEVPLSGGEDKTLVADATVALSPSHIYTRTLANKNYELKDQLASVRVVINDVKNLSSLSVFQSSIQSTSDNYAFGAEMPMRTYNSTNSRYGFQGYEKDNELKGEGNSYITQYRMYDPRVGRWLSTDPLEDASPSTSTYSAMGNNPVNKIDPDGRKIVFAPGTSQDFIEKYYVAIEYMYQNGQGDLVDQINNCSQIITIQETKSAIIDEAGDMKFEGRYRKAVSATVYWDPNQGGEVVLDDYTVTGARFSPTTGLLHEFDHVVDFVNRPYRHFKRLGRSDSQYGNKEERRVITGRERDFAIRVGEGKRENHKGAIYYAPNPTSTEDRPHDDFRFMPPKASDKRHQEAAWLRQTGQTDPNLFDIGQKEEGLSPVFDDEQIALPKVYNPK